MTRSRYLPLVCLCLAAAASHLAADEASRRTTEDALAVQKAMLYANMHLNSSEPAKAVAVLEADLHRIEGDPRYLQLLARAYRAHIINLHLERKAPEAEVYLRRLRILDPASADSLSREPTADLTTAGSITRDPAGPKAGLPEVTPPAVEAKGTPPPAAAPVAAAPKPSAPSRPVSFPGSTLEPTFRGKVAEEPLPDPFALANALPGGQPSAGAAQGLVAQGHRMWELRRYEEAGRLYEQACAADPALASVCGDHLGYCKLKSVESRLGAGSADLAALEAEVQAALGVIQNEQLGRSAAEFLERIRQERGRGAAGGPAVSVQHLPRDEAGWEVAATAHFRIHHRGARELAVRVAEAAEGTRAAMSQKWFGSAAAWDRPCEVYLHADAGEYSRETGVGGHSPGHSRIESDRASGRVIRRQIFLRCDNPDLLTAILPHETTHVVLAGQYGDKPVPRWVDEGVAVLAEPAAKVGLHKDNLSRYFQSRELFRVQELIELDDYPSPRRIGAFYAQSVSLVEYLAGLKGPQEFTAFVRDGLKYGYEGSLQRHYGFRDFSDLETRWYGADVTQTAGVSRP